MRAQETEKDRILRIRGNVSAAPAFMLCAVTLVMLMLDLAVPAMSEYQYQVYPLLVKCTGLAGLICASLCVKDLINEDRMRFDAGIICFVLFLICAAVSTCINGFSRDAMMGIEYRYIGIFDICSFFLAYMLCSSNINSESTRQKVLIAIMAVSDCIASIFLLDIFMPFVEAFRNKNEPSAVFFHGNHYGYFLVIAVIVSACICISGKGKLRMFGALSFGLNVFALAGNRSMGCLLAAGVILIPEAIIVCIKDKENRKGLIGTFVILALLIAVVLKYESLLVEDAILVIKDAAAILTGIGNSFAGHGRLELWQLTAEMIKERPLFGYGCEGISAVLLESTGVANPHNEVLTYAAFFGIPAAVLYTVGVIITLVKGFRSEDLVSIAACCAAAGYFVSSLFGVAMFYTEPFFYILLGLSCKTKLTEEQKQN